jgi:hypothetical protein
VEVTADRADHDLPGIQRDADVDGHAFGALDLARILFHRRLHGEGSVTRPHRMVFMGNGRPEQGHDVVPHDLVHRPLVAVHGRHHLFQ